MQEKPPFSSYFDFFPNVWEGDTPSHTHPLRTLILPSGTPLEIENWNRSRNAGEQHGSDVNIWLVSDLGLIITSDQHCQFLCRMPYNLQNPQIPLS